MGGWKPTKVCPTCGHEYGEDAVFCMKDGSKTVPIPADGDDAAAAEAAEREAAKAAARAAMQHAASPALIVPDPVEEEPAAAVAAAEPITIVDPPEEAAAAEPATDIEPAKPKPKPKPKKEPEATAAAKARTPMDDWDDGSAKTQSQPARPKRAKKTGSGGGGAKWGGAFSRFRNPWMAPLAKDAPTGIQGAVKAARKVSTARRAGRTQNGDKKFSETFWFLEGAKPDEASQLEKSGAVERDDGHYEKKKELPDSVRSRYSLDAS